jgi:hypothetical protein
MPDDKPEKNSEEESSFDKFIKSLSKIGRGHIMTNEKGEEVLNPEYVEYEVRNKLSGFFVASQVQNFTDEQNKLSMQELTRLFPNQKKLIQEQLMSEGSEQFGRYADSDIFKDV